MGCNIAFPRNSIIALISVGVGWQTYQWSMSHTPEYLNKIIGNVVEQALAESYIPSFAANLIGNHFVASWAVPTINPICSSCLSTAAAFTTSLSLNLISQILFRKRVKLPIEKLPDPPPKETLPPQINIHVQNIYLNIPSVGPAPLDLRNLLAQLTIDAIKTQLNEENQKTIDNGTSTQSPVEISSEMTKSIELTDCHLNKPDNEIQQILSSESIPCKEIERNPQETERKEKDPINIKSYWSFCFPCFPHSTLKKSGKTISRILLSTQRVNRQSFI